MESIKKDHGRFKKIIRGKLKENLQEYIKHGKRIVPRGKDKFSVPLPEIDLP